MDLFLFKKKICCVVVDLTTSQLQLNFTELNIFQSCGHCHEPLPSSKPCPYSNRTAPQKLPIASFSESVVTTNGKPKDYISNSCGPLGSESYGKYIIGSQALGQKIKRLQEVDVIRSPEPAPHGLNRGDHDIQRGNSKKSASEPRHPSAGGIAAGISEDHHVSPSGDYNGKASSRMHKNTTSCSPRASFKKINSENSDEQNASQKWFSGVDFLGGSEYTSVHLNHSTEYKNIEDLDALAFRQDSSGLKEHKNMCLGNREENTTRNERTVKPKVSLLAQLLESESETETKILPRLLDSDENSKDEKKMLEIQKSKETSTDALKQANDRNSPSYGELAPQSNDTSVNLIDGVLSCSDADKMLNMISMPELPDNFFNVDMSDEALDLDCEKAMKTIQMVTNENGLLIAGEHLDLGHPSASNLDCNDTVSQERQSPEIDIHPHSDGVVDDFPDFAQASNMSSPVLAHSLGKILGRPLNTSSPIPR